MRQELAIPASTVDTSGLPAHLALKVQITTTGVRQFAIAQRVGLSEGQLSKILAGRRPLSDELADQIRSAILELAA